MQAIHRRSWSSVQLTPKVGIAVPPRAAATDDERGVSTAFTCPEHAGARMYSCVAFCFLDGRADSSSSVRLSLCDPWDPGADFLSKNDQREGAVHERRSG